MDFQITELASAKLKLILLQESDTKPLAFRIVPLTTGCSTPSFALELTEISKQQKIVKYQEIPFLDQSENPWLDGLVIDLNRNSGKFIIYHPNPGFLSDCGLD